jgi:hypothetical protein
VELACRNPNTDDPEGSASSPVSCQSTAGVPQSRLASEDCSDWSRREPVVDSSRSAGTAQLLAAKTRPALPPSALKGPPANNTAQRTAATTEVSPDHKAGHVEVCERVAEHAVLGSISRLDPQLDSNQLLGVGDRRDHVGDVGGTAQWGGSPSEP